jgi:hypothetical protein
MRKSAFLTLKAMGTTDDATVTCKVETGRGLAIAGIHPKPVVSGLELCAGDMLLEALVACAGVSVKAAAALLDIRSARHQFVLKATLIFAARSVSSRMCLSASRKFACARC